MSSRSFDSSPAALASAVDASTTSSRIDKFDGTNFRVWKFKMKTMLEDRDLWDVRRREARELSYSQRPSDIQAEGMEGVYNHLSCDGGLADSAGAIVTRCIRSMDEVGDALREEESCEQAILVSSDI